MIECDRGDEVSNARLANYFKEEGIKGTEDKLNLSNKGFDYIAAMGLKAAARPEDSFYLQPVKWNRKLQHICSMYSFLHNGAFNHLTSLNLSHNKFETLDGMYLHMLPRLHELDLKENAFTRCSGCLQILTGMSCPEKNIFEI